jgi:hypothetical protein
MKNIEGNKLISEFMGATKNGGSTIAKDGTMTDLYELNIPGLFGEILYYDKPTKDQIWAIESLEFSTSWDWLMPVWRKVSTEICLWMCCHENAHYGKLWNEKAGEIQSFILAVDIKTAHNKIFQLIQWYNSQKP